MKFWLPITIRNCLRCTFTVFLYCSDWWTGDKTATGYTLPRVLLVGVDFSHGPVKGVTWTSTPYSSPSNSHFYAFFCFVFYFQPTCIQLLSNTCLSVSVKNLSPNCTFLPQKTWLQTFAVFSAPRCPLCSLEARTASNGFQDIWRIRPKHCTELLGGKDICRVFMIRCSCSLTFQVSTKIFLYLSLTS